MHWRLSFNVDDVTLASVYALDHVIELALCIGRKRWYAALEPDLSLGHGLVLVEAVYSGVNSIHMRGCSLCSGRGCLRLLTSCGGCLVSRVRGRLCLMNARLRPRIYIFNVRGVLGIQFIQFGESIVNGI